MTPRRRIQVGEVYGRLTVTAPTVRRRCRCRCSCGREIEVQPSNLRAGRTRSCGCLNREVASARHRKHGQSHTLTYSTWSGMVARCTRPTNTSWGKYGARGIKVCERWLIYENFLADMGPRLSVLYSIDRYPNREGNYEPGNCRWATIQEQNANLRSNHRLTIDGRTMVLHEWAALSGVHPRTIYGRLADGWDVKAAVFTPPLQPPTRFPREARP